MKKLFLLLAAGSICISLHAQESKQSVVFLGAGQPQTVKELPALPARYQAGLKEHRRSHATTGATANKTTTANGRWYDYGQYMDTTLALVSGTTTLGFPIIWNDTLGKVNYTSGLANNTMVSAGSILHPQCPGFNDASLYPGQMRISNSDQYMLDSIELVGLYLFNPAKFNVVDTLTISFTNGSVVTTGDDIIYSNFTDAATVSDYGLSAGDSVEYGLIKYDSVKNTAAGTTLYSFKIYLDHNTWGDTTSNGIFDSLIKLPVPYPVNTAGNVLGYTLTFKSGDANFIPGDTISGERYNIFRPGYVFHGTSALPLFAPYSHSDYNSGQFKSLPNFENGWENVYLPMYAWTSGAGAATIQHSDNGFHLTCTTCGIVNAVETITKNITTVGAYPNPSSEAVIVSFALNSAASVTVELTNTLGQVVATQAVNNTNNGSVTFNTAKVPAGIYFYAVIANGERSTGRVVVAH